MSISSQSDDGMVFGSWTVISLSQQVSVPSPAFVERASVPQTSHLYRFPSLLGMGVYLLLLLFEFHGLVAAGNGAGAAAGYDHLSAALGADISLSYGICHRLLPPS